jgi:hypothetical protein
MNRRITLFVVIALLSTSLWSSGGFGSLDTTTRARVAHQLVTERHLTVASTGTSEMSSSFRDAQGEYPSYFGPGQTLFFLPFDAVLSTVTGNLPLDGARTRVIHYFLLSTLSLILGLGINFWLCLRLSALLGLSRLNAYLAAFIATFGTEFWQMAKQGQEEVQISALILLATCSFIQWKRTNSIKHLYLMALWASLPLLFRLTGVTAVAGIVSLFLWQWCKRGWEPRLLGHAALAFGAPVGLSLSTVALFNAYKTGNLIKTGYSVSQGTFSGDWFKGILEPVLGLDRGIFWTSLWLFPALICLFVVWKKLEQDHRVALFLSLFLFCASLLVYCRWYTWAGDDTYGARYQVHVVPLLTIALWAAIFKWIEIKVQWLLPNKYQLVATVFVFLLLALQVPSIAFTINLEIYQVKVSGLSQRSTNGSPTGAIGQIWLRYTNFFSKLATGEVIRFQVVDPTDLPALQRAVRWRFWPWLAEEFTSSRTTQFLAWIWASTGVLATFSWTYVFLNLGKKQ